MTVGVSHSDATRHNWQDAKEARNSRWLHPSPPFLSPAFLLRLTASPSSDTMARGTGNFKRGGRGNSRFGYRGNTSFRGGRGRGRGRGGGPTEAQLQRDEEGNQLAERFEQVKTSDEVDDKLGFDRVQEGQAKEGWLINMHPVSALEPPTTSSSHFAPDSH